MRHYNMSEEGGEDFEAFTLISKAVEGGGEGASAGGLMKQLGASKEWLQERHAGVKPWAEFFNVKRLSRPAGVGALTSRVLHNLYTFQSNYLFVLLALAVYCLVTNPMLLLWLAVLVGVWWVVSIKKRGENFQLVGRETSAREVYAVVAVASVPILYFAGVGSAIFWIVGASVVLVLVHASFMSPGNGGQNGTGTGSGTSTLDAELGIVMEDIRVS